MGCCQSGFAVNRRYPGQGKGVLKTAAKLRLNKPDMDNLYRFYNSMDHTKGGQIPIYDFISLLHVSSTLFGEFLIRMFDKNMDSHLDFHEFIVAAWSFLTIDDEMIYSFAFEIFDTNNTGLLTVEEIKFIISLAWKFDTSDDAIKLSFNELDENTEGQISLDKFVEMNRKTPKLLEPLCQLQHRLREVSLGVSRWELMTTERKKRFGSKSIYNIIHNFNKKMALFHSFVGLVPQHNTNGSSGTSSEKRDSDANNKSKKQKKGSMGNVSKSSSGNGSINSSRSNKAGHINRGLVPLRYLMLMEEVQREIDDLVKQDCLPLLPMDGAEADLLDRRPGGGAAAVEVDHILNNNPTMGTPAPISVFPPPQSLKTLPSNQFTDDDDGEHVPMSSMRASIMGIGGMLQQLPMSMSLGSSRHYSNHNSSGKGSSSKGVPVSRRPSIYLTRHIDDSSITGDDLLHPVSISPVAVLPAPQSFTPALTLSMKASLSDKNKVHATAAQT